MTAEREATRVVRVIARLNIGGPTIQAITMTRLLEPRGYRTLLVCGREGPGEGSMDYLARELDVAPMVLETMRRDPGFGDVLALSRLISLLRRERPRSVHTASRANVPMPATDTDATSRSFGQVTRTA